MKTALFALIAALLSASAFGQTTYPPGTKFVAKGKTHVGGALSNGDATVELTRSSHRAGCRMRKLSGCSGDPYNNTIGKGWICTDTGKPVTFELTMPDKNGVHCEIVGINDNRHWVSGYGTPSEIMEAYFRYEVGPCPATTSCRLEANAVCTTPCGASKDSSYCPKNPWTGQCVTE